jgi:microcompartment protein CcmL/EutN
MKALGLIETKGLVVAIESADAMLKAAEVSLVDKKLVGGGLVAITITGEVAAVKAAVDAGAAAVGNLCAGSLISQHVIPRPADDLALIIPYPEEETAIDAPEPVDEGEPEIETETVIEMEPSNETAAEPEEESSEPELAKDGWNKETADLMAAQDGWDALAARLNGMKVVELRVLARQYEDFGILGRAISKADKKMLLEAFETYYR